MAEVTRARVRFATPADFQAVEAGVTDLLKELSGNTALRLNDSQRVFENLVSDSLRGGVLVAETTETDASIVGILTYCYGYALRTGGNYCTIQELWVHPDHRSNRTGEKLITTLLGLVPDDCSRIEVGLPGADYSGIESTSRFYRNQGFETIGTRAVIKIQSSKT